MKTLDHVEVGQKVWACAFQLDKSKTQMRLVQEPVYGEIRGRIRPSTGEEGKSPYYFIPYKRNSIDLAMSKKVSVYSRSYAETYEDCKEIYNSLVDENVNWLKERLSEIEEKRI